MDLNEQIYQEAWHCLQRAWLAQFAQWCWNEAFGTVHCLDDSYTWMDWSVYNGYAPRDTIWQPKDKRNRKLVFSAEAWNRSSTSDGKRVQLMLVCMFFSMLSRDLRHHGNPKLCHTIAREKHIAQEYCHLDTISNDRGARENAKIRSTQRKNACEYWQHPMLSAQKTDIPKNIGRYSPRTAGGLSHLRTAGGRMTAPPPRELEN